MEFPLSYWEIRLWLAINAIILLITAELLHTHYGKAFMIKKRQLRMVALILGLAFMITVIIQAYQTWQGLPP